MWYLIVSIPDLCHLSYFGYLEFISMVNVLYTRLKYEHYSKHHQTLSYKMVFERLARFIGYTYLFHISEYFFIFGVILKVTNGSFQKGMLYCLSIYIKKVMKLLAFIF